MKRLSLLLLVCLTLLFPCAVSADNTARDYIPAPPDTLATMIYYTHTTADTLYGGGHKLATGLDLSEDVGILRTIYYFKLGPFMVDPQFLLPFGGASLGNKGNDLSATGVGDLAVLATIWFVNNPQSKTWLGFTPFFFFPTGNYENNGALSLGSNRFGFREELGFVQGFDVIPNHPAYFELQLGGDFYTDNNDYTTAQLTRSQDPVLNVESHLSYDVTKALWASADYYYHWGGESAVAGIAQDDRLANHTLGFTLGYNIASNYQILFQYKNDVEVESGLPAQSFTIRFTYMTDLDSLVGKVTK